MRRSGMAALASGGHGAGAHFVAKFDDRHEAVAARAIPLLGSGIIAGAESRDRKSTRLNSSHGYISYAVFCLKKKKSTQITECVCVLLPSSTRGLPPD